MDHEAQEVKNAANFAVEEMNKQTNSLYRLVLQDIMYAHRQVNLLASFYGKKGKLREFGKNTKNQGNLKEFDSDPEGEGFRQFGLRAIVHLVPCGQVVSID